MFAQLDPDFISVRPWKTWSRLVAYLLFEGRPLTTRGRWVNPGVFALFRLWAALPFSVADPAPVLILGMGRSGTTLLGKVLGLHPDAGFLNEPKALWQAALGDDDLIGSYTARPGRYRMDAADATPVKIRRLRRFYRAYQRLSGSRVVVDKYPELVFRAGFLDRALPGARAIVPLRDGWQTAASIAEWSARHGDAQATWWGRDGRKWQLLTDEVIRPDPYFAPLLDVLSGVSADVDRAAIEWLATTRATLDLLDGGRANLMVLRFEDLAAAPVDCCRKILEFAGLSPDPTLLGYAARHIAPPRDYPRPRLHPVIEAMVGETMTRLNTRSLE